MARLDLTTLRQDASLYPQKIDLLRCAALFINMTEATYREASFLDDRILGPQTQGAWLPWRRLKTALAGVEPARPLHFILHSGHVGSTLVSRLLDETGPILALREPLPLRTLAEASDAVGQIDSLLSETQFTAFLRALLLLWARGFPQTKAVVLKATSATARLAPRILHELPGARAIYLNVAAETYLATLLAGRNSHLDLLGFGPERIRRLARALGRNPSPLHALSPGELAAMTWLTERLTQEEILAAFGARVLPLDFDVFLQDAGASMSRIARHFGFEVAADYARSIARSQVLERYSKSPDRPYSPGLRADALEHARREHAAEMRKGLDWLDACARDVPSVADVLSS